MKWARVEPDGLIAEFTFLDPVGRFHPSIVWVEVDDSVELYSRFTLAGIEPPTPPQEIQGNPDPAPQNPQPAPATEGGAFTVSSDE